eukprot:4210841-Ditylum_brightwellii.AAC.1
MELFKATPSENVDVGKIGFMFCKKFNDGIYYTGKVVKVRLGAANGLDQQCVYEDEDSEDLSVAELELLASSDPNHNTT